MCQHKYFLNYALGLREVAGKKADKGNAVHKALELLARYKFAIQNNQPQFTDDELGNYFTTNFTPEIAIREAWGYIQKVASHHTWEEADFNDCRKWMYEALEWRDGMFSPLKREIVAPEQYFEFEIREPWAAYDYVLPDGSPISGYLGLKGTIDLMVKQGNDLEMIDWKTGLRLDWSNFKPKTYEKLMDDPQLRIYHYAASRLYPNVENIFVTIFFLQDGGPESICFTRDDLKITEEMLRRRFNAIRNTIRPKLVYPSKKCNFCHYKKVDLDGKPIDDYNDSMCKKLQTEVVNLGLDKVMKKYSKAGAHDEYGDGGGRKVKDL